MLHDFLQSYKKEILELTSQKTLVLAGDLRNSKKLKVGLPIFYDQLIFVLKQKLEFIPPEELLLAASNHGQEFLRLGYSLSHVVHAYGAMCQAITELATIKNADITPSEFNTFNACLDVAIASAVSQYQFLSVEASEAREVQHLGFLAHELRNALSSATIAQEMIKAGFVGTGGSTAALLESNLARMRHLIDRSLSEVRMRADADVFVEKFRLSDLFDQIIITAKVDSKKRNQTLLTDIDLNMELSADRQFILSAIANLVQNAIKYSKLGAKIILRARELEDRILIEVEDQCGGIDPNVVDELFEPFNQGQSNKVGLGLGLSIAQRAIQLNQGTIKINNKPGVGCIFCINVPRILQLGTSLKTNVTGVDSLQPNFKKK